MTRFAVLATRELVEVGSATDADRRAHFVWLGPLFIRQRMPSQDEHAAPAAFLTFADFRAATSSGEFLRQKSNGLLRLCDTSGRADAIRMPAHIVGETAPEALDTPLKGLSWHEANLLTQIAGGRLPDQKEADYILSRHHDRLGPLEEVTAIWTASALSMFDYSYRRFDRKTGRWIVDQQIRPPASVADRDGAQGQGIGGPGYCVIEFRHRTRLIKRRDVSAQSRSLAISGDAVPMRTVIVYGVAVHG